MRVSLKIKRFDATKGRVSAWSMYALDAQPGDPVLVCLDRIKDEQDGTLTFRENCRNAICGSCAMRINGKAALACKTHVGDVCDGKNPVLIEPMSNMSVMKDLVVDMDPFWKALRDVRPYLLPDEARLPQKEFIQPPPQRDLLSEVEKCIMCGACFSDCEARSVEPRFLGPAALAKAYRYLADSRDAQHFTRLKEYNDQHAIWDCTHCFQCNEVCPVGVKPLTQILKLQRHAMDAGFTSSRGAKHHRAMVDIVVRKGILDENALAIKSVFPDPLGMLGLLPVGLRMLRANKMPPLIQHKLDSRIELSHIAGAARKEFSEDPHGERASDF